MLHFQRIHKVLGPGGWFPNVTRPRGASRKPRGRRKPLEEASRGFFRSREPRGSLEEASRNRLVSRKLEERRGTDSFLEEASRNSGKRRGSLEEGSRSLGEPRGASRNLEEPAKKRFS
eukprot:gene10210-biopygen6181